MSLARLFLSSEKICCLAVRFLFENLSADMGTNCEVGVVAVQHEYARVSGNGFDVDSNLFMFVDDSALSDLDVPKLERTKFRTACLTDSHSGQE